MPVVLGGVVGPAAADAVAPGECAVEEDEVGVVLAQGLQQARGAVGEQVGDGGDIGVGGADGYPEGRGDAGQGVVAARVHKRDQCTRVRRELASAVTFAGDEEHRDHSTKA